MCYQKYSLAEAKRVVPYVKTLKNVTVKKALFGITPGSGTSGAPAGGTTARRG